MGELKNRYHDFYYTSNVSDSNAFITSQTLTSAKLQEGMNSGYFYIDTNNAAYTTNRNAVAQIVDDLNPQNQFELEEAFRLACDFVDSENMDYKKLEAYMTLRASDLNLDVLNEDKIYYTYSVVNIVYEQIQLSNRGKNKIDFVDVDIITAIKNSIINRKEELSNSTGYEGSLYTNGLLGVYERINQYIIENNGTAIL